MSKYIKVPTIETIKQVLMPRKEKERVTSRKRKPAKRKA